MFCCCHCFPFPCSGPLWGLEQSLPAGWVHWPSHASVGGCLGVLEAGGQPGVRSGRGKHRLLRLVTSQRFSRPPGPVGIVSRISACFSVLWPLAWLGFLLRATPHSGSCPLCRC